MDGQEGFCPISHIPLNELKMAVVFHDRWKTVYDAESVVHWLKEYSPKNPMTNEAVPVGRRIDKVLTPIKLPHMDDADVEATARFLKHQRRLWLASHSVRCRDGVGLCMCVIIWVSGFYGFWFLAGCSVEAVESGVENFSCLIVPLVLCFIQMTCVLSMCWLFPELHAPARLAVYVTLICVSLIHAFAWMMRLYLTSGDGLVDWLAQNREWVQIVVEPRGLHLLERVLTALEHKVK